MRKAKGFTLVELLVVITIILVLVGLLTPVLARARRAAMQTVGVSNLHQLSEALLIYADDHGGPEWMPPFETAQTLVAKLPKCDPLDDWSPACEDRDERPLLGSYGYAPAIIEDAQEVFRPYRTWASMVRPQPGYPLLASPFGGGKRSCKFYNGDPEQARFQAWARDCAAHEGLGYEYMPDPIVRVGIDGAVVRYRHRQLWAMWPDALSMAVED